MIVLSHRGLWKEKNERNTLKAFETSFREGFGTELDIRDYKGELVISHDIADDKNVSLRIFFDMYRKLGSDLTLALNIKSDGLAERLNILISEYNISNYFVFDMSVPDSVAYLKQDMKIFSRQSEYEKDIVFYPESIGVWMDEFNGHWIRNENIEKHIDKNKKVCIVSPDLHDRTHEDEWAQYKKIKSDNIMICTDYPEKARRFFDV